MDITKEHKILVVDDDVTTLKLLENSLKSLYEVRLTTSAEQALIYLEKESPTIILLDIEMPGMNGYEMLEKKKNIPAASEIPIIFLTGRNDVESEVKALELGAKDYLHKPIVAEQVLARAKLHIELEEYRNNLNKLVLKRTQALQHLQEVIISMLADVTESRDESTGSHISRTMWCVRLIAEKLKNLDMYDFTAESIDNLIKASQLHDIGKVSISDLILLKPDVLTDEEYTAMKKHTQYGFNLLSKAVAKLEEESLLNMAQDIALYHHERWDGTGYPKGLKGEKIPISVRIMSIADVYDALRTERPYKRALPASEAKKIIFEGKGSQFDPKLVDIFEEILPELEAIYEL